LLQDLVKISSNHSEGPISYAAGFWEVDAVPWERFDVIGVNAYVQPKDNQTEDAVVSKLKGLKGYSKPVHVTEFGCCSYTGAAECGGGGAYSDGPYDEDEQANYYRRYLDLINRVKVDGCFTWIFSEVYAWDEGKSVRGFSIINNITESRKKAFYVYKSYQRSP
jgi:beta-glucosidase/6-phospho-beta-glucosidase/beta-galactosidase